MSPDQTPDTTEAEPEMARRCPVCETVFTVTYPFSRQVFCSPTCKVANRNSKPARQTCPVCENEFTTTVARRRTYCSEECRSDGRTSDDIRDRRVCLVCNGSFEALKPPARSTVPRPAAKTPSAAATRQETKTAHVVSVRPLLCRHGPSCLRPPNLSADPSRVSKWPRNVTRWNRPRPATVPTASSRSPSSRFSRPPKPPALPSLPPAPTSFRCEGHRDPATRPSLITGLAGLTAGEPSGFAIDE